MAYCYRHPDRETGVACSNCGRPICPDCMTPTPVGMRCPECSKEKTRVISGVPSGLSASGAPATMILIGLNVVAFLIEIATGTGGFASGSGTLIGDFGLQGAAVNSGEWYRLVSSGFLHAGLLHIAFNMYALYILGRVLEPAIGTPRFVAVYFASMLAGSFGALLLSNNLEVTIGASGAIFGVFGATFVIAGWRGSTEIARGIGAILLLNLVLTFAIADISIGGHLGGLIGGLICGVAIGAAERGHFSLAGRHLDYLVIAAVAIVSVIAAISVTEPAMLQVIRLPG